MVRTDSQRPRQAWARLRERLDRAAGRDVVELAAISAEALSRYKLRTALSVLGVVLGVAAVIAMMSVSEGARHEALQQMEMLGLDNIVIRSRGVSREQLSRWPYGLTARDADAVREIVPLVRSVGPLVERFRSVNAPPLETVSNIYLRKGYAQCLVGAQFIEPYWWA